MTWNVINPTVDDHRSLLDPLSFHHLCFAHANNQDVCFTHLDRNTNSCVANKNKTKEKQARRSQQERTFRKRMQELLEQASAIFTNQKVVFPSRPAIQTFLKLQIFT